MKPSVPKGTRDFSPLEMKRRNYIFDTIRQCFQLYGYSPLETPSMENLSTLMGKYGEEGDKLIFKILNSGDYLSGVDLNSDNDSKKLTLKISEKALRYDLTVPFARYVVQHQNEITFPFKRYQIQPVWRADRPQKGRYREFYQCDADVVGSDSLINEADLLLLISDVFKRLKVNFTIKLNNRKILSGLAELTGESERLIDITVAIDKLDKIGIDKVVEELQAKGVSASAIDRILPFLKFEGTNEQKLDFLNSMFASSDIGRKGVNEVQEILELLKSKEVFSKIELDLSLARGLNYYTGAIIEVKADEGSLTSSICGGGRYDDLTGIFGLKGVSGVGISFGADRIYDVMEELKRFPENNLSNVKVLFFNLGKEEEKYCYDLVQKAREKGISTELYPDNVKIKKQFSYAESNMIPWAVIVGSSEMEQQKINVKNLVSGEQQLLEFDHFIELVLEYERS